MNNVAEAPDNAPLASAQATSTFWSRRRVFWVCFALTAVLYSQPYYWNWLERRDQANWDYFSQVIARGGVPYRDVVNIKTPASTYIGGAAILVARPFGLRDIYAIRATYTLLAALTVALTFMVSVRMPSRRLKDQLTDGAEIVSLLESGDKIFVHGQTEILVLSGLTNASKYTNLDHGKDSYLDLVEPGGFAGWFQRLRDQRPKIVMLSRTANLDRTDVFLAWLASDYEQRTAGVFTYYVRIEH